MSKARKISSKKEQSSRPRQAGFPIVGIGASAGGLDAFKTFFSSMPADSGMAFVLVQHLDPTHESLTADLLARHTAMSVVEIRDRIPVEVNHVYMIPPNKYLTIDDSVLHLSEPVLRRGMRMPIDYFFRSLAEIQHEKAIGIILSGTGTDGTLGLKAIKGEGGIVLAQKPETAQYDGMPRSAIVTGLVDYVAPIEEMPEILIRYVEHAFIKRTREVTELAEEEPDHFRSILAVLRSRTKYDFNCYKKGTLLRRIGRRMSLNRIEELSDYLVYLREHGDEAEQLFKDLLIGVTGFFREAESFAALEEVIGKIIQEKPEGSPIRIWVPGCATGEEAYSIAMLVSEQLQSAQKNCPLQLFATDIDDEALTVARAGLYPENIAADIVPERLRRFFKKEDHWYRVNKAIRDSVVFAAQNLIADPPFSKLDVVSCRNLLIYLETDIQKRLIDLFHFALNQRGYLYLGSAETIGQKDNLFEPVAKKWRLFRRVGTARRNITEFPIFPGQPLLGDAQTGKPTLRADPTRLGELARGLLVTHFAPASVLVNRSHQILYYYGPTERYLDQPTGTPTNDVLLRIRDGLRVKLRALINKAIQADGDKVIDVANIRRDGDSERVKITVNPVKKEMGIEDLLLVSFEDTPEPAPETKDVNETAGGQDTEMQQLENELNITRDDLQSTIEEMESSNEELKAANEEVMSVNEELQSTNEELETSKEELQSLNEELSTVNNQLEEKVRELEVTNDDLSNLLSSTEIATIFLDTEFRIKRFTPATSRLFNLIATDVDRPLSDISGKFHDEALLTDAKLVLDKLTPIETEVLTEDDQPSCYIRRVLPYRTQDNRISGVVVTFVDISQRKRDEGLLDLAKDAAERASQAKSRFLTAASHDLRQPLQALSIINGVLAKKLDDPAILKILGKESRTIASMGALLDTLLNLSELESGNIKPKISSFPVADLLDRFEADFKDQALNKGLHFRTRPSCATIRSDRVLLEHILRNFADNAIKYTDAGKVLVGCRRRGTLLSIEVWDTGIGIANEHFQSIFEQFVQLDNPARESSKGIGLGLSIAQNVARILGHKLDVRSVPGKGSMFAIEVPLGAPNRLRVTQTSEPKSTEYLGPAGALVLLIEDDPGVRNATCMLLKSLGVRVVTAVTCADALAHLRDGGTRPDLIIADYRLPNGTGLEAIHAIRESADWEIPAMIITGETTGDTVRQIKSSGYDLLFKPIHQEQLVALMNQLIRG